MWKAIFTAATLLILLSGNSAYIWERTRNTGMSAQNRYQRVPPAQETADKLMRYFMGLDVGVVKQMKRRRRHRSVSVPQRAYTQFDAIFLIDSSASILPRDFRRTLHALKLLTTKAQPDRKYAAISFSHHATLRFNFSARTEALGSLGQIPFEAGKTNTQDALDLCRKQLIYNQQSGARPRMRKRVLIITDGQSNVAKQKTLYRAFQLKSTGTPVFVIAVGNYLKGISEIVGLASSTDAHLYRVADSRGLLRVVRLIPPWHMIKTYIRQTWLNGMLRPEPSRV